MDQRIITYFLYTKSTITLILKIKAMSRVILAEREGGYMVTMTCPVNRYKDNMWWLQEHHVFTQQTFIKCWIGTVHCARHWDTAVNMAGKTLALREPARGREDNKKEKEGNRILLVNINSCEVF